MGNSVRLDPQWVDHLVSQLNLAHLLASQRNLNSIRLITGWWIKRVDSRTHLIKKTTVFFFSQN